MNFGVPIAETRFRQSKRAVARSRAGRSAACSTPRRAGLIAAGNTAVRQPYAQIWGAPEVSGDYTVFLNTGLELTEQADFYAFGNLASRETEGGFFFRNPDTTCAGRNGVFVMRTNVNGNCERATPLDDPDFRDLFPAVSPRSSRAS